MTTAVELMKGGLSAGAAKAVGGEFATAVSAAGTTLSDATALVASNSNVTTVGAASGVRLPNTEIGDEYFIYNGTTTELTVYPPTSSGSINQIPAGTGMKLAGYTAVRLKKFTATVWQGWLSA